MNWAAHRLSAFVALTCLVMGLAGPISVLGIGPPYDPPSWVWLYRHIPAANVLYPLWWLLTAALAALGIRNAAAARWGFQSMCGLFLVWGVVGFVLLASQAPGANIQGPTANLTAAWAFLALAYYVRRGVYGDTQDRQIARLGEQAQAVVEQRNGNGDAVAG